MHYVSQYNYFKSVNRLTGAFADKSPSLSEAIAGLSQFSLRHVLNNDEIMLLYKNKTTLNILKKWANSGVKIDAEKIRMDLQRRERYFVPQYVMKVNTPRYHANQDCEFLQASFDNFETPPEIAALGPEKISEFQAFCDKEWPRYKNNKIDVFWAHVGSHFNMPEINPKEVSLSSHEGPMNVQDESETDLLAGIHRHIEYLHNHAISTGITGHLYAPAKTLYSFTKDPRVDLARRQALIELLKLKKAIKMLVFNFHRIELDMPEGLLSDELLEALGFLPCKACCPEHRD